MSEQKYEILKNQFGYETFRKGQEPLVDAVLSGRDTLGIMPTGAGKSICFQVPALCFSGITLVISPLISLMKDQVTTLVQSGVRAAYLNSSLTYPQYLKALENAKRGVYKIIYVAPERLMSESFLSFAKAAPIAMVTVDEAHCVSQWGHDFRPSYLKIHEFVEELPVRPVLSAFTATATEEVREDIIRGLKLQDPYEAVTGFDRENLYFEVRHPAGSRMNELMKVLANYPDRSGIVYCATRKNVETVCEKLREKGIPATRYHAGLTDEERRKNQEDFLFDECPVMVATNAFGMGIDKSNVGFVIHYNMPKNMESYYQEAGRAGRDGSRADCVLLYSAQDILTNRFFIEQNENEEIDEDTRALIRRRDLERLNRMVAFCNSVTCLREYILTYFGETAPKQCGNCSCCLSEQPAADETAAAKVIIDAVDSVGQRFGKTFIIELLRGSDTDRMKQHNMYTNRDFGLLAGYTVPRLQRIIDTLIALNYLTVVPGEYPVLQTTRRAERIMTEDDRILIRENAPKKAKNTLEDHGMDDGLYGALRAERARLAKIQGVPAFVIFSDATLQDMCWKLPKNQEEFLLISGVGYAKLQRYGEQFLKIIAEHHKPEAN